MSRAAVVIGRNEGARLIRCLASLKGHFAKIIYVDSGSDDGSIDAARIAGAEVVELDLSRPFTAARARNAGLAHLVAQQEALPEYIQFLDGDCEMHAGWPELASRFLEVHPDVAVVCGRRRERHPGASVYNGLIDREWDTPIGATDACGGDAMMRSAPFQAAGGYDPGLIAGEEPELCLRLRRMGWTIWRLDAEMTLHDADLMRLTQWWQRTRRAGHAYAEGAHMHGAGPERHYVAETRRALLWGLGVPLVSFAGMLLTWPWGLALLLIWPVQVLRLRLRGLSWSEAFFLTLSKLPETQGILQFHRSLWRDSRTGLIEYK